MSHTTPALLESFFLPNFSSRLFAVLGASTDSSKFGHTITSWYVSHGLPVIPINPNTTKTPAVCGVPTAKDIFEIKQLIFDENGGKLHKRFFSADGSSLSPTAVASGITGDLSKLDMSKQTTFDALSISVVTPPAVSLAFVKSLQNDDPSTLKLIKALWFQPGSFNQEVLDAAYDVGIPSVIAHGECILVKGERLLSQAKL